MKYFSNLRLHLNLDLNLDSTKLDLGLGLDLARGQSGGVPKFVVLFVVPSNKSTIRGL